MSGVICAGQLAGRSHPAYAFAMADESSSPSDQPTRAHDYDWLRWAIRITGILLMFAGAIYLLKSVSSLLWQNLGTASTASDNLFALVISLVALGIGIFVVRTGLKMFQTVDASAISHFSFVFTLVYTFVLMQILPLSGLFHSHLIFMGLLLMLYFGLSYWVLQRILLHLLLPVDER